MRTLECLRDRWDALLKKHRNDPWVEPERPPGPYSWTRPWMFTLGRQLHGGFSIGFVHSVPGEHWMIRTLYGPRIQCFSKDQGRPGEIWNPHRWGGAVLGLEIGCRG